MFLQFEQFRTHGGINRPPNTNGVSRGENVIVYFDFHLRKARKNDYRNSRMINNDKKRKKINMNHRYLMQ